MPAAPGINTTYPQIIAPGPYYAGNSSYTCPAVSYQFLYGTPPYSINIVNASSIDSNGLYQILDEIQTYTEATHDAVNFVGRVIKVGTNISFSVIDSHGFVGYSSPAMILIPGPSPYCQAITNQSNKAVNILVITVLVLFGLLIVSIPILIRCNTVRGRRRLVRENNERNLRRAAVAAAAAAAARPVIRNILVPVLPIITVALPKTGRNAEGVGEAAIEERERIEMVQMGENVERPEEDSDGMPPVYKVLEEE